MAVAFLTTHVDFTTLCAGAIGAMEPSVPWESDFLVLRRRCYAETDDGGLPRRRAIWKSILRWKGLPLDAGVPSTPLAT